MITNYGGKLSACIRAWREGGRVGAAFLKREAAEGVERWKKKWSSKGIYSCQNPGKLFFYFLPISS